MRIFIILGLVLIFVSPACIQNCEQCSDTISCTKCNIGFFLKSSSECEPCPRNCDTCSITNGAFPTCTSCSSGAQMSSTGQCFKCIPSCSTCSLSDNNCTSCSSDLVIKVNETSGNYCYSNNYCQIYGCIDCQNSNLVCNKCSKGFYSFRRACDKCLFPVSECDLNIQALWDNEVLAFWNQQKLTVQNYIKSLPNNNSNNYTNYTNSNNSSNSSNFTNSSNSSNSSNSTRLLQNQKLQDHDDEESQYSQDDRSQRPMNESYDDNDNNFDFGEYQYRVDDILNYAYKGNDNYTQVYQNWDMQRWNTTHFNSYQLSNFQTMNNLTRVKGWIQTYFFFKAVISPLVSPNVTQIIYKCLPIMEQLINLSFPYTVQWNHFARFVNNITGTQWNGQRLETKMKDISASKTQNRSCHLSYFFNQQTKSCDVCSFYCLSCSSITTCNICNSGYYLTNGLCSKCDQSCLQCQGSSNKCTSCYAPLILDTQNRCTKCDQSCKLCSSTNSSKCALCSIQYSYFPNSQQICYQCNQKSCTQCKQNNVSFCLTCGIGFGLLNGLCLQCPNNCADCLISSSNKTCLRCVKGFQLISNMCWSCGPRCVQCSVTNPFICTKCQDGSFLQSSGKCVKCLKVCQRCQNSYSCLKYRSGLILYKDIITHCQLGCVRCDSSNPSKCLECANGFYLQGNICNLCSLNCIKCTNSTVCNKCPFYKFVLVNQRCQSCSTNCLTCTNTTSCTSCIPGYKLQTGLCLSRCGEGCLACNPIGGACLKCGKGYGLKSNGVCIPCIYGCEGTCDAKNISSCVRCSTGYQSRNGRCIRCPLGCTSCMNNQCLACQSSYRLMMRVNSFVCIRQCLHPCMNCTADYLCLNCTTGYKLQNSICVPDLSCGRFCNFCVPGSYKDQANGICNSCRPGCSNCFDELSCGACFDGFYLSSSQTCIKCVSPCLTCSDSFYCKSCVTGYVIQILQPQSQNMGPIYGNRCIACHPSCKTCLNAPDQCFTCHVDFILRGSKCISSYLVAYQFKLDRAYKQFLDGSESSTFSSALCQLLNINQQRNLIQYLKQGSTVVGGIITTTNLNQANNLYNTLANQNTNNIGNYPILTSNIELLYNNLNIRDHEDDNQEQQGRRRRDRRSSRIGIIIGAVVGGVVLVAVIIIIVCKCCLKKKAAVNEFQAKSDKSRESGENLPYFDAQNKDNRNQIGTVAETDNIMHEQIKKSPRDREYPYNKNNQYPL